MLRDCSRPIGSTASRQYSVASMTSIDAHINLHNKTAKPGGRFWGQREPFFLANVPNGSVVLDLGAGSMHFGSMLADRSVTYIPVDAIDRGERSMRVCNFNRHEYPIAISPTPTVLVVQGLFEYIYDKL